MSNEHVPPPAPLDPASKPPKKGDWLKANQIAEATQKSSQWVQKKLTEHLPEEGNVQRDRGKRPVVHYPRSVLPKLKQLAEPPQPAGDWLTVHQIAKAVLRHDQWVSKQLAEHFPDAGEIRLDDKGRAVLSNPPEVLPQLKKLAGENPPVEE